MWQNYSRKKFYSTGPRVKRKVNLMFHVVLGNFVRYEGVYQSQLLLQISFNERKLKKMLKIPYHSCFVQAGEKLPTLKWKTRPKQL